MVAQPMLASRIARFEVGETVTVLVGSKAGDHASVEHVVWSERDHCHYFYLAPVVTTPIVSAPDPSLPPVAGTPVVTRLSRGYRADELAEGVGDTLA